jgi:TatD DNase family protein
MYTPNFIDTHTHLDDLVYRNDIDTVLKHAREEGVWVVSVGNDYASSLRSVELAEKYDGVWAAIGLHPLKVSSEDLAEDKLMDLEKFSDLARHPKVVALGECGLDWHELPDTRHRRHPQAAVAERIRSNQKKVLAKFFQLSEELRLPLLLHCREAHDETLNLIETWDKTSRGFDCRGIVHHFSGDWKQARRYFNLDFMISFTGLLAHGGYQNDLLRRMPMSRLTLESECPHLTPVRWSQRRNEPSYLPTVAAAVAGARGVSLEEISRATTENALKVLNRLRPAE